MFEYEKGGIAEPAPPDFLAASDVPENLLRLRRGDAVRFREGAPRRRVHRVGYRKSAMAYLPEAEALLSWDGGELHQAEQLLRAHGVKHDSLRYVLARGLAARAKLGGPERGVHVLPCPDPGVMEVISTRRARLGTYYPPSGRGEDYEDGGLSGVRALVVVETYDGEFVSGDLERAPRIKEGPA